ncbi:hypothetical protein GQ55_9G411600 [Panicum hallii var. hallii]|uniref:Uncharacterized protein n=1 Tax=Panicum hallii var. hallii TaxID=1504633 RepID=A0A2T7CAC1_9POAL|nr:hypothetical protein GQ55_9G411600 [Panicum hallii var. hallii]
MLAAQRTMLDGPVWILCLGQGRSTLLIAHCQRRLRVWSTMSNANVVDSPLSKKTKSMEYYVKRIYECMIERTRYERSAISREQEEVREMLQLVEEDGVPNGSELYFIATELFRSRARLAAYRSIKTAEHRIAWLRWTWYNIKKK